MKALHFLGIFMFALRWHQAESVVRFVAAELFFKSGTILFGSTSGQGERFQYLRQNQKNDLYHDRKYNYDYEMG